MKSERIRRGVKRTKPDVVELLRSEVQYARDRQSKHLADIAVLRSNARADHYNEGYAAGLESAFEEMAERLQEVIDEVTEE